MQENNCKSDNALQNTNSTTSMDDLMAISSLVTADSLVITVDSDIKLNDLKVALESNTGEIAIE
jgi:hypothetical protein